jgi:cation diffusion facilitator family transporter
VHTQELPKAAPGKDPQGRKQQAAAVLSLSANVFLVLVKIAAGFASGSVSVLAEGIQSGVDVVASALILLTVRVASAPPDEEHPYGHGKAENLASMAQMLLILGTVAYLMTAAWNRWRNPVMPHVDWGIAALLIAIATNILVSAHLMRVSRETGSQALAAEATHLRSDMLSCVGVLVGLILVWITGQPRLDPLVAGIMTVFITVTAVRLLRDSVRPLLDESLPADEAARVKAVLDGDPRVLGYHRLRTRRAGATRLMDLHLLLDDDLSFREAHAITEDVEGEIRRVLPNVDVIVHAEPFREEQQHQREHHGAA